MREDLKKNGPSIGDIMVIADIYKFICLRGGIEDFESLPLIILLETQLGGWNEVLKRAVDAALAAVLLVLLSPLFFVLHLLVRLTSPGPAFYRQERMSLDGRTFMVWKFRSMDVDAESETGAVWASPG